MGAAYPIARGFQIGAQRGILQGAPMAHLMRWDYLGIVRDVLAGVRGHPLQQQDWGIEPLAV